VAVLLFCVLEQRLLAPFSQAEVALFARRLGFAVEVEFSTVADDDAFAWLDVVYIWADIA
jgi:hypothetical protein